MSTVDGQSAPSGLPSSEPADLNLEAVVIPVADADRSEAFYAGLGLGATVSRVFFPEAQLDPEGTADRVNRTDPDHKRYNSFATFEDAHDLAAAMNHAESAHNAHEKRIGWADSNWPDWYAEQMVREQSGQELLV
jgi:hypothetical protein